MDIESTRNVFVKKKQCQIYKYCIRGLFGGGAKKISGAAIYMKFEFFKNKISTY